MDANLVSRRNWIAKSELATIYYNYFTTTITKMASVRAIEYVVT